MVIVTGSSSGIGKQNAYQLAEMGAHVILGIFFIISILYIKYLFYLVLLLPLFSNNFTACRTEAKTLPIVADIKASMSTFIYFVVFYFVYFVVFYFVYFIIFYFIIFVYLCVLETGNQNVEFMKLDLISLKSVADFVEAFKAKNLPLHILLNNAGIYLFFSFILFILFYYIFSQFLGATVDGKTDYDIDATYGSNHVG